MTVIKSFALLVILSLAGACTSRPSSSSADRQQQTAPPTPAAAHAAAQQPAAENAANSQGDAQAVTGTVEETMNASNYTYVRVKAPSGDIWAATSQFPVKVGDKVTVPLESPMQNFHSQSLKRDFPIIYFTSHISRQGEQTASASPHGGSNQTGGMPPNGSPNAQGGKTSAVTEPIAPPQGGTTIAKVWDDRKSLAGKKVTVRGKVVKYNGGIMGRNWIHIQDGSGKAGDGTNDLTLTTNDDAKVGDVITATGTVTVDKDFGAGYRYTVMLENATVSTK